MTTFTRCGKRGVFFDATRQRSKGVTKVITQVFFPAYKVQNLRGPTITNKGGLCLRGAKIRGKLLDRQLATVVGDKLLLDPPPRACEETKKIMMFIREHGYYIEHAQYAVGYAPWRLATDIDLILRTVSGKDHRIVVEVKRGCLYRRQIVPNATSQCLEKAVKVSPLHVHQLQAVIGKRLLELCDTTVHIAGAWLLYVDLIHGVERIEEKDFGVQWSELSERALEDTATHLVNGKKRRNYTS
jgi:hypothetical protein